METHTFTFSLWACLIPIAISLVPLLFGIRSLRRRSRPLGWFLVGSGVVLALVFGPMLFTDRIVIDDRHIEHTTGFWFAPTRKGFVFAETERVRIRTERVADPRSSHNVDAWYVYLKTGKTRRLVAGDLWSSHHDEILELLRARGVDVSR